MRITVLDGHAVNPGDISWKPLSELGELTVYDESAPEQVRERGASAEALLTDSIGFPEESFAALPRLRYLGLFATGFEHIDLEAAAAHGVTVCNVPAYSTPSVAQAVFALLLNLAHRVREHDAAVHEGRWITGRRLRCIPQALLELEGKVLGVIGLGAIGTAVAVRGRAFGMEVLAYSRSKRKVHGGPAELRQVELHELFARSDVVTLHVPLTPETKRLVNADTLALMKPGAFLVNTARGGLVDEQALAEALREGRIGGAGLDVLGPPEPPAPDNPLLNAPNCVITPHIAWATPEARSRCLAVAAANLEAFQGGTPRNVVAAPGLR